MKKLQLFIASDDGAVTIDWVFLTSICVTLASIIYMTLPTAISTVAENTRTYLEGLSFF